MIDTKYYNKMLEKDRLMPIVTRDKFKGFITYYIGNEQDKDKFVRDDMWSVLEDDENGNICFIDQLITSKEKENPKLSYEVWHRFKEYIKKSFPNVKYIRWNRWKNNKVNVFIKNI